MPFLFPEEMNAPGFPKIWERLIHGKGNWIKDTPRHHVLRKIIQAGHNITYRDAFLYKYLEQKEADIRKSFSQAAEAWGARKARFKQYVEGNMQAVKNAAQLDPWGALFAMLFNKAVFENCGRLYNAIRHEKPPGKPRLSRVWQPA